MYFKNLLQSYLLFFICASLFSLPTAKAGGCKGTLSISKNHKDILWDKPTIVNDSLTINPGDTIILKWNASCEDDGPPYILSYWYKDGVLVKTDSFGYNAFYGGKDSILITEGGIYKIEVPVFETVATLTVLESPLGVNNPLPSIPDIEIYPNPVNDILNIKFKIPNATELNYLIYNDIGHAVRTGEVSVDGIKNNELNIEELSAGLYTMLIHYNNTRQTGRFIKN